MPDQIMTKLNEFMTVSTTDSRYEAGTKSFVGIFENPQRRPPIRVFMQFLTSVKDRSKIKMLSSLLDTYAPSFILIPVAERDDLWDFLIRLTQANRESDRTFFTSLWTTCETKKIPLDTILREVILLSMLKHSGLYNDRQFDKMLGIFEKKVGRLAFELLANFEDEDLGIFPVEVVAQCIKIWLLAFGPGSTSTILTKLCERKSGDDYFDFEFLWLEYGGHLFDMFQLNIGEFIIETQKLATLIGITLPSTLEISKRMLFPVSEIPVLPDEDPDD